MYVYALIRVLTTAYYNRLACHVHYIRFDQPDNNAEFDIVLVVSSSHRFCIAEASATKYICVPHCVAVQIRRTLNTKSTDICDFAI